MIRLARIGKKKQPHYRLVVSEKARDLYGRHLEILGHYNPRTKKAEFKKDRILHWLKMGAQASATVHNLLITNKIVEGKKLKVSKISKKRAGKKRKEDKKVPTLPAGGRDPDFCPDVLQSRNRDPEPKGLRDENIGKKKSEEAKDVKKPEEKTADLPATKTEKVETEISQEPKDKADEVKENQPPGPRRAGKADPPGVEKPDLSAEKPEKPAEEPEKEDENQAKNS